MDTDLNYLEQQATDLLKEACCEYGIWATPNDEENYRRVWARDSVIGGIAGLLTDDERVIKGLRDSIITLARYQHTRGMIPSNVLPDKDNPQVSYGTLAGRVDANTWFVIGSCLYLLNKPDAKLLDALHPKIEQVLNLLDQWEFNGNGLLYTPLSGNWADEYPIEGHTLYDNSLRLWALRLYNQLFEDPQRQRQAQQIEELIKINFWPSMEFIDHPAVYHSRKFKEVAQTNPDHFMCAINPQGYNTHFDTAANGFALLMQLGSKEKFKHILDHLKPIFRQVSTVLMPAFWPVITSNDSEWESLKNNFNYHFKNYPHQYHNGGIWLVWMGWFALGAVVSGNSDLAESLLKAWLKLGDSNNINFSEYIASDTLRHQGKERMVYSASGLIFLLTAIREKSFTTLRLNLN